MSNNTLPTQKYYKEHIIKEYYTRIRQSDINSKTIKCSLCPNNCVILNGKTGLCHARTNRLGKFYSIVYGYPCSINVDPIEKKPLYHFMPGEKILSLGTFGCNLFCKGCQNFDISRIDNVANAVKNLKYYSPEDIVDIALKDNIKMIAYTYNEPTIFFEYMIDIAKIAKRNGIKNVIVSNGYINKEPIKKLCKYIDAANIDIKGINPQFYKQYSRANVAHILENIKIIHDAGIFIELTNLIIPGLNDSRKDIKNLCSWIKNNLGINVPIHFSRFYPYYDASNIKTTPIETLKLAREIALDEGLEYVYTGNLGVLDDTICSKCANVLISRSTRQIVIKGIIHDKILELKTTKTHNYSSGKCSKCSKKIFGVW